MANAKSTQMWFAKAREDLKVAQFLNPKDQDLYAGIVFHCQQCAEKAIKGFLTFHDVRVLKTHNMERLLLELAKLDDSFSTRFNKLPEFSKYAVGYRYPDAELNLPQLTEEKVIEAISLAAKILNELTQNINSRQE